MKKEIKPVLIALLFWLFLFVLCLYQKRFALLAMTQIAAVFVGMNIKQPRKLARLRIHKLILFVVLLVIVSYMLICVYNMLVDRSLGNIIVSNLAAILSGMLGAIIFAKPPFIYKRSHIHHGSLL